MGDPRRCPRKLTCRGYHARSYTSWPAHWSLPPPISGQIAPPFLPSLLRPDNPSTLPLSLISSLITRSNRILRRQSELSIRDIIIHNVMQLK